MKTLKSRFTSLWLFRLSTPNFLLFDEVQLYSSVISSLWFALPPSGREVSSGNRSNYKSTRERVDSEGLYGRWTLHLMGIHYYHYALAGYYMYIEASLVRQGENAKLQVSVSGNGAAACLVFFYHMYGDAIGTLNVYSGNELVFIVSGNQGNYWIRARKTIYLRHIVSFWSLINFSSQGNATVGLVLVKFQTTKICTYTYIFRDRLKSLSA